MRIGIIVYSQTGNTLSVAEQLAERLASEHEVTVEQLRAADSSTARAKSVELTALPDLSVYDALVLGAPVEAFSLASVMNNYLAQIDSLPGKPVALLVTQFFPYPWMGGNRAIRQMRSLCQAKGADVVPVRAIINWSHPHRDQNIIAATERLSQLFSGRS